MNKSELQIIKKVIPTNCPECKKEIFVGFQTMVPTLTGVITKQEMLEAKKSVKERLEEITFNDPNKKGEVIKWIDDENTLIDQTDVEDILRQIVLEQSPVISDKKTNKK